MTGKARPNAVLQLARLGAAEPPLGRVPSDECTAAFKVQSVVPLLGSPAIYVAGGYAVAQAALTMVGAARSNGYPTARRPQVCRGCARLLLRQRRPTPAR